MLLPKSIVCYCRRSLTELLGETNTQISKLPLHIVQQTQSSTVIPTFQWSKHKRIPQSWSSLIWNKCKHIRECAAGLLGAVPQLWFQGLPQWPWIHSEPPPPVDPPCAHPCTCRHSVGYCLMQMRISLYQGKHWCSSAIVLIVPPRSIILVWLSFIHLCDWACVRACVCLCWVSVYRCSCTWPIVPIFAFRHANMRPRRFRPDASNRL